MSQLFRRLTVFLFLISYGYLLCAQQELLSFSLTKLNRDSLTKIIYRDEQAKNFKNLGLLYERMYDYFYQTKYRDSATIYALKSEECFYKAGDSANYYRMQIQLGELCALAHDLSNAEAHYQTALKYYSGIKDKKMLFHAYGGLANVYMLRKDTAKGVAYESLAVESNKEGQDTLGQVILNDLEAQTLIAQNKIDQSIALLHKNILLIYQTKNLGSSDKLKYFWRGLQLNLLGKCYIIKHDYPTAIKYLKQAAKNDELTEDLSNQNMYRSRLLTTSYIQLGQKDSALKYLDSFFNKTNRTLENLDPEKINEISIKYETEKKQRDISELQQKNKIHILIVNNQRKLNTALSVIFLLAVISSYVIIKNIKQKKRIALELSQKELAYKEQLHKQKELEIRNRISRDLHDDLGATLSSVKAYSEILKDNPGNSIVAELIKDNATDMIERLELIAWATDSRYDSFGSLVSKMEKFSKPLLVAKQISYSFSTEGIESSMSIPGEIRQNLLLIFKECINNITKHAAAKNCIVTLSMVENELILKIQDDGTGIKTVRENSGNGLINIRNRTKELAGSLDIKTETGEGTVVFISIPYPDDHK